jgi:hypothetical protein
MSTVNSSAGRDTGRLLPVTGVVAGLMWLLARVVTDALEHGTTHDIITSGAAAQRTILDHQAVIVVEAISTFYLAAIIVVFAAVVRHALGDSISTSATFGSAVLLAAMLVLAGAVSYAELAAAHHHNTDALTTLGYLAAFSWAWKGLGLGFFAVTVGWTGRRTRSLPRWFTIVTFVLGGLAFAGPGYVLFWALAPVWFALVGLLLRRGQDRAPSQNAAAALATRGAP